MQRISSDARDRIISLRRLGNSIPEISKATGIAKTTIQRHVQGVEIPEEYYKSMREKQGGAKARAEGVRANMLEHCSELMGTLTERDHFFLLVGLYWGEGTKKDFSIINSDPSLIQTFVRCLRTRGITDDRLSLSLRLHDDLPIEPAKKFWSKTTGLSKASIGRIEIIKGKKKGKLPYGMCRVRVRSGIRDRLVIQTAISLIGKDAAKRIVST